MPILTNDEVAEFRKMSEFAFRLIDLCEEVVNESDFMVCQRSKIEEIADKLGVVLPPEETDDQT